MAIYPTNIRPKIYEETDYQHQEVPIYTTSIPLRLCRTAGERQVPMQDKYLAAVETGEARQGMAWLQHQQHKHKFYSRSILENQLAALNILNSFLG
jgi:uncharacterized protein YhjY with autotransporter beta-barrel domain